MKGFRKFLIHLAKRVEHLIEFSTDHRLFGSRGDWRVGVRTYPTYGAADKVCFRGRVLRDHAHSEPTVNDRWWRNFIRTFHSLESDEVGGAVVELTFLDNRRSVTADSEGYIDEVIEIDPETPVEPGWTEIKARIQSLPYGTASEDTFCCRCMIPDSDAEFGIISDIDDTVLVSNVTQVWMMLKLLLFGNATTRAAVPGTPAIYQSMVGGRQGDGNNPVFYVSSSPWNLHPMLTTFMAAVGLPAGPLMLRDLGMGRDAENGLNHGHKETKIRHILETYPNRRFVLLGDAGQEDAAIYSRICDARSEQIIVAYIRQLDTMPSPRVVQAVAHATDNGTPMFLLPGTESIALDLRKRGLIPDDATGLTDDDAAEAEQENAAPDTGRDMAPVTVS